jgi:hypothetical protein
MEGHGLERAMLRASAAGDWRTWEAHLEELVTVERERLGSTPTHKELWDHLGAAVRHLLLQHMDEVGLAESGPRSLFSDRRQVESQLLRDQGETEAAPCGREQALARMVAAATCEDGVTIPPTAHLARAFELDAIELAIVIILYVGEVDPRVGRSFRFAMGQYDLVRPDQDLLSGMLFGCPSPLWSLARARLKDSETLRRYALLTLGESGELQLSTAIIELLDGRSAVARSRRQDCADSALASVFDEAMVAGAARLLDTSTARLVLAGPTDSGRDLVASLIAAELGRHALVVDGRACRDTADLGARLRDARLAGAVACFDMQDCDTVDVGKLVRRLRDDFPRDTVIVGTEEVDADLDRLPGATTLAIAPLTTDQRCSAWEICLERQGLAGDRALAAQLAAKYPLPLRGIEAAVTDADARATLNGGSRGMSEHLALAAARQVERRLGSLAERVTTELGWADVVLPEPTLVRLMEMISFARYQQQVLDEWGFGRKMPYGRALTALFHGPPGTGKTMVASLIAHELDAELFRVDLSAITSKWIGETEKNLARLFAEAKRQNAVLLFDEADALFGRRTEVKSSSDRFGNMNVNYLLQAIEDHEGVVILTTNLDSSIDEAFKRRIRFSVEFAQPGVEEREHLWAAMIPDRAEKARGIDYGALAREFEMSGAYIKESVLRAAFMSAERGTRIDHETLHLAARRVYREMGHMVHG